MHVAGHATAPAIGTHDKHVMAAAIEKAGFVFDIFRASLNNFSPPLAAKSPFGLFHKI